MTRAAALLALALAVLPSGASAQATELRIERGTGQFVAAEVFQGRGYAAVEDELFRELGWTVARNGADLTIGIPGEIEIALRMGTPFFHWDGLALQLAEAPYLEGDRAFVPLQLLTDFLPRRLPDIYDFDGPAGVMRAGVPTPPGSATEAAAPAPEPDPPAPEPYDGPKVVIIDAGHGGADPGAMGPGGIREKDVALGIALHLAALLREDPDLEVHLTRDDDTFVDIWDRGEIATEIKGERPGLFMSIHANSFPETRSTRGFETYFLSEARTDHERRVQAIENAPITLRGQDVDPEREPDLGFILRELRNLDHQHWSSLLAEMVQDELDTFHPSPNRGVKQGVLAVLTNALMPSVLVETGYLSNTDEARLLSEDSFQRDAAEALARSVRSFFERYPPSGPEEDREQE